MKQALNSTHRFSNSIVAGILSSFLFLGIGGRIAMRFIAILAGQEPRFTVEGTIAILLFSTFIGIISGALFPVAARHLPSPSAAKGGTWGMLLFVVLIPMLPEDIHHEALYFKHLLPLTITLFGLLFILFGLTAEFLGRALCSTIRHRTLSVLDIEASHTTN